MAELSAAAVIGGTSRVTQDPIWGGGVQLRYGNGLGSSNWSVFANATATTGFNAAVDRLAWDFSGGLSRHFARFDVAARAGYAGARLRPGEGHSPSYAHGLDTGAEIYTGVFNTQFDIGIAVDGFFALRGSPSASPQLGYQVMFRWAPEKKLSEPAEVPVVDKRPHAAETIVQLKQLPNRICKNYYMFFTRYEQLYTEIQDWLRYAKGSADLKVSYSNTDEITLMSLDMLYDVVLKDPLAPLDKKVTVPTREAARKMILDAITDDLRGTDILCRISSSIPCPSLVYYLLFEGDKARISVANYAKYPQSPAQDEISGVIAYYENLISKTEVLVKAIEAEFGASVGPGQQKKLDDVKSILACLRNSGGACEARIAAVTLPAIRELAPPVPLDFTAKE